MTIIDEIKGITNSVEEQKKLAESIRKALNVDESKSKSPGRSTWFALGAIAAMMVAAVSSNNFDKIFAEPLFSNTIMALLTYAVGRQIVKEVTEQKNKTD